MFVRNIYYDYHNKASPFSCYVENCKTSIHTIKSDKDLCHCSNYRPISVLPTLSTIAGKAILNHLQKFFSENNKIPHKHKINIYCQSLKRIYEICWIWPRTNLDRSWNHLWSQYILKLQVVLYLLVGKMEKVK